MVSRSMRLQLRAMALALFALLAIAPAHALASETATELTNSGNDLRDGWYPEESALNEQLLSSGTFGQEWSSSVEGQVYGQPLLDEGTLFVATEANWVYGLNPATGAKLWQLKLSGTPWSSSEIGCADLAPTVGVTATPVIDPSTGIAYITDKSYVSGSSGAVRWQMDAIEVKTGKQVPGFPVTLSGDAQNAPNQTFEARDELQRPGLLLLEGVVYAAFGSDCDHTPYQGWVFGVSTSGQVKAKWASEGQEHGEEGEGAGIWQSGAGLTSDGPHTILLATGNGDIPAPPILGSKPPVDLGEAIVRLNVRESGELQAVDFFAPYDAQSLNTWDADFGSGGVTGLPGPPYFGTATTPKLAVAVGKDGYVYLLNREDLGGYGEGPAGEDDVVQRLGPYGGVWSRPGVWPGEGGWVYIPTASGGHSAGGSSGNLDVYKYGLSGKGEPALSLTATSSEAFGFSSSAPVITSNGTQRGSALVWMVWSPNGSGAGAQLRAYAPVPVGGQPVLLWSAPVGTSSKFALPGVGLGRLYVGTRDGHVIGFGSPVTPVLRGSGLEFPTTIVGESSEGTLTLTATEPLTIDELVSSSSQFERGEPSVPLPAKLEAGKSIQVPVTFSPTATGPQAATLRATTSSGKSVSFSLSGEGQASQAKLEANPTIVTLGGTAVGETLSGTAHFSNVGAGSLKILSVKDPEPPFYAEPVTVTELGAGGELSVPVSFKPSAVGSFEGAVTLETTAGSATVHMTGTAALPPHLSLSTEAVSYGEVSVGQEAVKTFTISNTGELPLEITISKPPVASEFHASSELDEGTEIQPGETLTETVTFKPTAAGAASDDWRIAGKDGTGVHEVHFTGTGTAKPAEGKLEAGPAVGLGTTPVGHTLSATAIFKNVGAGSLQVSSLEAPQPPFGAEQVKAGPVGPGGKLEVPVTFTPTVAGEFEGAVTLHTSVGSATVHLTATATSEPASRTGGPEQPVITLISNAPGTGVLGFDTATQPAHAKPAPAVTLLASALTAGQTGQVTLRISCPPVVGSCSGSLTLRTLWEVLLRGETHPAILTLAASRFLLPEGRRESLHLHLSRAGRALVGHERLLHVRAVVLARDPAGTSYSAHLLATIAAVH